MDYEILLNSIKKEYKDILKDNLVGIYVHGSIAMGCFNWNNSDIDFIVVVNETITQDIKIKLMDATLKLNKIAPPKGLEMSIVLKENCINFIYPTPFELHFSNTHIKWYMKDKDDYCKKMNGTDIDLAAHFTIINKFGLVLDVPPICEVFGNVSEQFYIESIKCDIENAKDEVLNNPTYIILNLCRVLAYVNDNVILSKLEGGEWGLINLDENYSKIIISALDCYKTNAAYTIKNNETIEFCDYVLDKINRYSLI